MGYYSFNRPKRDGRLSWSCWLTDSRRFTHKVVKQPSISLAQDRESQLARTDVPTTMLRHQLLAYLLVRCHRAVNASVQERDRLWARDGSWLEEPFNWSNPHERRLFTQSLHFHHTSGVLWNRRRWRRTHPSG